MTFRRRDFFILLAFFAVTRLLAGLFRSHRRKPLPAGSRPADIPSVYRVYAATVARVDVEANAIAFTWRDPKTGNLRELYGRLTPDALVKVDGARLPLNAVRVNADATIIARIETAPGGKWIATVQGIVQPP